MPVPAYYKRRKLAMHGSSCEEPGTRRRIVYRICERQVMVVKIHNITVKRSAFFVNLSTFVSLQLPRATAAEVVAITSDRVVGTPHMFWHSFVVRWPSPSNVNFCSSDPEHEPIQIVRWSAHGSPRSALSSLRHMLRAARF